MKSRVSRFLGGPADGMDIEVSADTVMVPVMNMSWGHYDAWGFVPYRRLPPQFDDGGVSRYVPERWPRALA